MTEDRAVKNLLRLLFLIVLIATLVAMYASVDAHDVPLVDHELRLGDRPLVYLDLAGNSCMVGVEEGSFDSLYPDKWHCHGWISCEPYWAEHGFTLSGTAHVGPTESRPGIACGEPEDHTLYLEEGMVTFLEHEVFLVTVAR